jgi:hypothetical protein
MKLLVSILFSFALLLSATSCGNHDHKNTSTEKSAPSTNSATTMYECPMKCEPATDKAGKCNKCGMDLVEVKK